MPARPGRAQRPHPLCHLSPLLLSLATGTALADGFVDDSHASLTLRNYYLDRDYQDDSAKS
ncbi:OprD family outer membrane porin, partial [Metapseudomonas otitidis]